MVSLAVHLSSVGSVEDALCYFLFCWSNTGKQGHKGALHELSACAELLMHTDDTTAADEIEFGTKMMIALCH